MHFIRALPLQFLAGPALAAHSGAAPERSGFALSDLAMFVVAAAGLWLAQRAMRRRKPPRD